MFRQGIEVLVRFEDRCVVALGTGENEDVAQWNIVALFSTVVGDVGSEVPTSIIEREPLAESF